MDACVVNSEGRPAGALNHGLSIFDITFRNPGNHKITWTFTIAKASINPASTAGQRYIHLSSPIGIYSALSIARKEDAAIAQLDRRFMMSCWLWLPRGAWR